MCALITASTGSKRVFLRLGRRKRSLLAATPEELAQIGETAYGGSSPYPPGIAMPMLDGYVLAALDAAGHPQIDSPEYGEMEDQFFTELLVASEPGDKWADVGALLVALNFSADALQKPLFIEIMDRALLTLRDDGVAYTAVPQIAIGRYTEIHGWDGAHPSGWPRALEDIAVPAVGEEPPCEDLHQGETRTMTQEGPGPDARKILAKARDNGTVVAVVDGIDVADQQHKQWELGVEESSYPQFLRALGERLVTPAWWVHDDLKPYFPCRLRSRDELRTLARGQN